MSSEFFSKGIPGEWSRFLGVRFRLLKDSKAKGRLRGGKRTEGSMMGWLPTANIADLINAHDRIQNEDKALLALLKYFPSLSLPNCGEARKSPRNNKQ